MDGECVRVVGLSFVPLCKLSLHVLRSTAGQTLGTSTLLQSRG